jgi:hypothetical protein
MRGIPKRIIFSVECWSLLTNSGDYLNFCKGVSDHFHPTSVKACVQLICPIWDSAIEDSRENIEDE